MKSSITFTDKILHLFYEYEKPVTILTKSIHILDSLDILKKMAQKGLVHVDFSIAFMDEELRRIMEPGASSAEDRFRTMKILKENGITTGIFLNPVLPFFTENSLEDIFSNASVLNASYAMLGFLHLNRRNYADTKRSLSAVRPEMDFESYFNLNGRSIHMSEEECYKISEKCFRLSRKYNVPLITSKHHQFLTGDYDFGVFRYRYPLAYDYIKMLKDNPEKN